MTRRPFDLVTLFNTSTTRPAEWPDLFRRIRGLLAPGGASALVSMMAGDTRARSSSTSPVAARRVWRRCRASTTDGEPARQRLPRHRIDETRPGESVYGIVAR